MSAKFSHATVLVYEGKVLTPSQCVCLKKKCTQASHQGTTPVKKDLAARLGPESLLYDVLVDKSLTQVWHSVAQSQIRDKKQMLYDTLCDPDAVSALVEKWCVALNDGAAWSTVMHRVRNVPHTRKHMISSDALAMLNQCHERYVQTYFGGVLSLRPWTIEYDVATECDVAQMSTADIPITGSGGDIVHGLEIFVPYDVSPFTDADQSFGSVTLSVGTEFFERQPLVARKHGVGCTLLSGGVPSILVPFFRANITCALPVSPVLDAPISVPHMVRYRCSAVVFADPREREAFMSSSILLPAIGSKGESPWIVANGTIAKFVVDYDDGPQGASGLQGLDVGALVRPDLNAGCCDDDDDDE
jgi:hypothetical protein